MQIRRISRYTVLEIFVESWERYFMRSGRITRQGRVRAGFGPGYLAALAALTRLGTLIGVERVERPVFQSTRDWLLSERQAATEAAGDAEQRADDDASTEAATEAADEQSATATEDDE